MDRMTVKGWSALRWTASGCYTAHASLQKPKVLLLDEHTAALDPKTAAKVLTLTDKIIKENT